jgi:hypothetical protein
MTVSDEEIGSAPRDAARLTNSVLVELTLLPAAHLSN